jgi:3-oxoacyl-[acyl-carrier protein] reductase
MDLGLTGLTAVVCASSKGLGRGCAMALAREGVAVVINGRDVSALRATEDEIRSETGARVTAVVADLSTSEGRAHLLAACPQPDILITNIGGPPTGDFLSLDEAQWLAALRVNMVAPLELIRSTIDAMQQRHFGRIVNITSAAVKAPIADLPLSNGARLGLTGVVGGLARQVVRDGVTINNLLPGSFDTDRLRSNAARRAERTGRSVAEVIEQDRAAQPSGRFGSPAEFGATCAFLCSRHGGFITGQNIVLDGGFYPGTF